MWGTNHSVQWSCCVVRSDTVVVIQLLIMHPAAWVRTLEGANRVPIGSIFYLFLDLFKVFYCMISIDCFYQMHVCKKLILSVPIYNDIFLMFS